MTMRKIWINLIIVVAMLLGLNLAGYVEVQAQSTVPYRFYAWSDGNYNGVFDASGQDICWRTLRPLTVYGNGPDIIEPLYDFNTISLATYFPTSQSSINMCMGISTATLWLKPNYPFVFLDDPSGATTGFVTVSGGTATQYIGVKVPW